MVGEMLSREDKFDILWHDGRGHPSEIFLAGECGRGNLPNTKNHNNNRIGLRKDHRRFVPPDIMAQEETVAHASGVVHVSNPILVISALPLLCLALMGRDLGMRNELIVAIIRSFVQLMVLGLILHPIFTIGMDLPLVVGICKLQRYSYHLFFVVVVEHSPSPCFVLISLSPSSLPKQKQDVFFMTLIATRESMTRIKYTYKYHALMTFLAIFSSIIVVGAFAFLVVIRPEPRWNPQYVIPICGMLLGNCISGVSLTVNDLTKQMMEGGRREIELLLSFGATGWESILRLTKEAVGAGATPMINSLNVIGLVSIPGGYSTYMSWTRIVFARTDSQCLVY
jgi:ABC-type iron transport system FetAB permease component